MASIKSYRDLQVWQRALGLAITLYRLTDRFPKAEAYGLTGQLRRAAVSIPSNVAEGHARPRREFARFLAIARGSLAELETQLEIAFRIGYLEVADYEAVLEDTKIIGRQLNALLASLEQVKSQPNR